MPRVYKSPLGSRSYRNYSKETLQKCLEDVRSGKLSQRKASDEYKIPIVTLKNKLKNKHPGKPGGKAVFSENEEKSFVEHLIKLSEFGFPVSESDFRMVVKNYLEHKGVIVTRFRDNTPGYDWVKNFLKRYPQLTVRFSQNVKRVRAGITAETIESYSDHLSKELDGVPPSNIWNYDETNVCDDPGNKRSICKRGMKYFDRICNHSKSSTSIMFCGNAEGRLLPPYIVFKAEHIWSTWVDHGPQGARYNRSKSGWFDSVVFEDWFRSHFLPNVRHLQGPVALIGDNLSSHLNSEVLKICSEKNIKFICLPPNATHIAQPLDVAFFGPLKRAWRSVLSRWRDTAEGSKYPTLPKERLPSLLKELMLQIEDNEANTNLIAGFKKCGIVPVDKNVLLARLPNTGVNSDLVGAAFLNCLDEKRKELVGGSNKGLKRKKINVPPGKSITVDDILVPVAPKTQILDAIKKKKTARQIFSEDQSSSDSDAELILESDGCSEDFSELNEGDETSSHSSEDKEYYSVDDFVIVMYNGAKYPGIITEISNDGPVVDCLEKGNKSWHWPEKKDKMYYTWDSVIKKIVPPKPVSSKRNKYFSVPELDVFI